MSEISGGERLTKSRDSNLKIGHIYLGSSKIEFWLNVNDFPDWSKKSYFFTWCVLPSILFLTDPADDAFTEIVLQNV